MSGDGGTPPGRRPDARPPVARPDGTAVGGPPASWSDERGWALRPTDLAGLAPEGVRALHVVSVEPGAVRGNHRHPHTTEWMLVFGGAAEIATRIGDGSVERTTVEGGPRTLVFPPGVAHAVRGCGAGPAFLVCWSDGEPETERVDSLFGERPGQVPPTTA